jgi:spermidine synthase
MTQEAKTLTRGGTTAWQLVLSVVTLGMTTIVSQVILLREFLSVFYGNELIIGITLANWMLLTALGSYLGRYLPKPQRGANLVVVALLLLTILPPTTVYFLRFLRNIVFPAGMMIGVLQSCAGAFALLFPLCIVSGASFTLFVDVISESHGLNSITKVYSWESIGSFIGGLAFNIVLITYFQTFQCLLVLIIFNAVVIFIVSDYLSLRIGKYAVGIVLVASIVIISVGGIDNWSKGLLFKDQHLLYYHDTPYGNLAITGQADQKNFYENNVLLFSTNDPAQNEEAVHYAMVQHPGPRNVLLISGGISGTALEALKYNVERIDYVELNPGIIEIGRNFTASLNNDKIHVIAEDARLYIKKCSVKYDVVLLNLPDPGTAQINRYYTAEFFAELKTVVTENAIVSISLLQNVDYYGKDARLLNSIMVNTLKSSFRNIEIVPGSTKNYFLASDGPLRLDIARMIGQKGIKNIYVNQYYIDDELTRQRSEQITRNLDAGSPLNRDFTPVAYYRQLRYWLSYFDINYWVIIGLGIAVLAIFISRMDSISLGMFTGGFTASATEIILLIAFQVMYGYVYQMMGFIISVFMAGLAIGSLFRHKLLRENSIGEFIKIQFAVGIFSILLPIILVIMQTASFGTFSLHFIFLLLTFAIASLIGMEFSLAAKLKQGTAASTASSLYGADLFGSAIGASLVSVFLIPRYGIIVVNVMLACLSFASGCVTIFNRKHYLVSTT